jgi:GntR family transcriptional regulator
MAGDRAVAYRTLAARIRTAIRDGEYADGRQLPTEEQLTASYAVSRQTVRRAMQELVSEGIIYRVAGRGTYPVAEEDRYVNHFGSVEELMALSLDTECQVVSPLQRKVDVEVAGRLRLPSDEIFTVTLVRLHADIPFCFTSVYLPTRIGRLLTDVEDLSAPGGRSRLTVIGLIDARMTGSIAAAEQSISAAGAPEAAAGYLGRAPGEPLLRIDRLYFDEQEDTVELAVSYFDPERYSHRVRLRRRAR